MDPIILIPLVIYVIVMSITPGPNTLMLATAGLNFGVASCLPHVFGITFGLSVQLLLTGFGLGAVFAAQPRFQIVLKIVGTAYLLWLSWRLWRAGSPTTKQEAHPISFFEAAAFQFVNPKAWLIAVTICAVFLVQTKPMILQIAAFSLTFLVVGAPCMLAWAFFGASMHRIASDPQKLRWINRSFAGLAALTGGLFWI